MNTIIASCAFCDTLLIAKLLSPTFTDFTAIVLLCHTPQYLIQTIKPGSVVYDRNELATLAVNKTAGAVFIVVKFFELDGFLLI